MIHPVHRGSIVHAGAGLLVCGLIAVTVLTMPTSTTVTEQAAAWATLDLLAIVVAVLIVGSAWFHYRIHGSNRVIVFGALFLGVSSFELVHALQMNLATAGGEPLISGSTPWFRSARVLAGLAMIAAALPESLFHRFSRSLAVLAAVTIALILAWATLWLAPGNSLEQLGDAGQHSLIGSGSAVAIVLYLVAASLHALWLRKPSPRGHADLVAAGLVLAIGEIAIVSDPSKASIGDLLGHGFRILGALFLIRALLREITIGEKFAAALPAPQLTPKDQGAALPTVLAEIDASMRILHLQANPADLLAGASGSLRGRRLDELLPDQAAERCRRAIRHAERSGVPQQVAVELRLPSGTEWVEVSIARRPGTGEETATFTMLAHSRTTRSDDARSLSDTSPSKLNAALLELERQSATRTEDELVASVAAMAEQLTLSQVASVLRVDPDGRIRRFGTNSKADTHGGASESSHVTELADTGRWADGFREGRPVVVNGNSEFDSSTASSSDLSETSATRRSGNAESAYPELDDLRRWISVPVFEDNTPHLLIMVGNRESDYSDRDVLAVQVLANAAWATIKRKRQERQLRLLSFGVDQSPNPILITDADSRIQYVNSAFQNVTGYSLSEVYGKNPSILSAGQTPESTYQDMWQTLATGRPWQGELINRRKDGQRFLEQALIYPVRDKRGEVTHYLAHIRDITERREIESRVHRLTRFDQLTGLPNHTAIEEALDQLLSAPDAHLSVLWINLDNFKLVNESLGRDVGNLFLLEAANRLRVELDRNAMLARQSGDSFVVVLPHFSQEKAAVHARRLMETIQRPCRFGNQELSVTASVGAALAPDDAVETETLLRFAEAAMHEAKRDGRNAVRFYSSKLQRVSERTLKLISGIAPALQRGEMRMVYQPQMRLSDDRLIGAEALIRWRHPELGDIPPSEFIPLADQGGLLNSLGAWVLGTVTRQISTWRQAGLDPPVIAINLSSSQLAQRELAEQIRAASETAGIEPRQLELEVTEAAAMKDPQLAERTIGALSASGFGLAIDDFGSGYSSMNYLKRFSVDCLKIDASFIDDLENSEDDRAIVRAIIQMAHSLGMRTLAEGVERGAQVDFLRDQGCDAIQGYWYARPLEVEAFETFCSSHLRPD